ncbi:MAG TPA: AtpZ/AtpI family protein [Pricia sp.]|nr:AtpZ/AtpI family protein [Pricia sp.]
MDTWIKFSNIGLQMAVIIGLMAYLGVWLDGKYPNTYSVYTIIFSLIGVFAALYNVFRQVRNMNDEG